MENLPQSCIFGFKEMTIKFVTIESLGLPDTPGQIVSPSICCSVPTFKGSIPSCRQLTDLPIHPGFVVGPHLDGFNSYIIYTLADIAYNRLRIFLQVSYVVIRCRLKNVPVCVFKTVLQ